MHPATHRRTASRLVLVLFATLALTVGACASASPTPTPVPSGPLELAGTKWVLIKYLSPGGADVHGSCLGHAQPPSSPPTR